MSARNVLHPLTLASIEMQPWALGASPHWTCGCERRTGWEATHGKWWLCSYHEGFDDALDALAEHQPDRTNCCRCCGNEWPCPTHRIIHGEAQR